MYLNNLSLLGEDRNGLHPLAGEFLDLFGVNHRMLSIPGLVEEVLGMWVTKGTERWHEPAVVLEDPALRRQFWRLVQGPLPLYHRVLPSTDEYDETLVVGKTYKPADRTNAFLLQLRSMGFDLGRIAQLGGDRATDPRLDDRNLLTQHLPGGLPPLPGWSPEQVARWDDEGDVLEELWKRSVSSDIAATFVRGQRTVGHRANTSDTYRAWLAQCQPKSGSRVLIISMAPHIPFQYHDARNALPADFTIDIAGPSAELGPQTPSYFTGAFGRWARSWARAEGLIPQDI